MSYTRTYHGSVAYSGTVSVSYPASQSGGVATASYSGTVPVNINIHVDTNPFDTSVSGAAASVDTLTGAVAAMETAQIVSIEENSKNIADRIISGFFHTINSDLTTQKTENSMLLKSKFALLSEYGKALSDKKERMESDMARIREHYGAIFRDIDKDYQSRIHELDKAAFLYTEIGRDKTILNPEKKDVPMLVMQASETEKFDGLITTARLRNKISSVVSSVMDYLYRTQSYKTMVSSILDNESSSNAKNECVPVVFFKEKSDNHSECRCFSPDFKGKDMAIDRTGDYVNRIPDSTWTGISENEFSIIDQSFSKYLEQMYSTENAKTTEMIRVSNEIKRLWTESKNSLRTVNC